MRFCLLDPENPPSPSQTTMLNLGWMSAGVNSIFSILLLLVVYKISHFIFSSNTVFKSGYRNWISLFMFGLFMVDLIVGCVSLTSVVMNSHIYQLTSRNDVKQTTLVFMVLQKILFSVIILTQLFEWANYCMFLAFQGNLQGRQIGTMQDMQPQYNKREKCGLYSYMALVLFFAGLHILIEWTEAQFFNLQDEVQKVFKDHPDFKNYDADTLDHLEKYNKQCWSYRFAVYFIYSIIYFT